MANANVVTLKGSKEAPVSERSKMDTLIVGLKEVENWKLPPFQRPLRVNEKVRQVAEELKSQGGMISGILTLGRLGREPGIYLVDGQHRVEGFKISGLPEMMADVRICHFDTMAEMADEFVRLNSALVRMRPDDILRGLEPTNEILQLVRKRCSFVDYDNIRRGERSPVVGMSAVLRCWAGSANEVPTGASAGAAVLAQTLDVISAENMTNFLVAAHAAWGRDPEYYRLWANLNMTLCMWLYRRLVVDRERGVKRYVLLNVGQFKQCLMAVSAASEYLEWLPGRQLNDHNRAPCYSRLKIIFSRRLTNELKDGQRVLMPSASWVTK